MDLVHKGVSVICCLMVTVLVVGCGRGQSSPSAPPATMAASEPPAPAATAAPLSELAVQGLLQHYMYEGAKGPITGNEMAYVQSVDRELQAGRSPKPPGYWSDLWKGSGRVRLAAWSDQEIFVILDFRNDFNGQSETMKWHLVRNGSEWLIENHSNSPAGRWYYGPLAGDVRLAGLRPGSAPQEVETALGKAQSVEGERWIYPNAEVEFAEGVVSSVRCRSCATGQGLRTGMTAATTQIVYGAPDEGDRQLRYRLTYNRGDLIVVLDDASRITELQFKAVPKPVLPPGQAAALKQANKIWSLVLAGDVPGLRSLVAPETDQLEFYADGVGGSGSEYERGLVAVTRWVKEHANETNVLETRVGPRKEYYTADGVELNLGSRSAYIFVRISDQRLTKIYIGRDSGV